MADLYKGIAGSPITYLTADISADQTTISIADDSALPDAPNICTIGYGENLETIKYGVKSNGVLQEVVRGIEGTPRAWPAGTEVARFFTAYDHNAIIENFNSHLAESAIWKRIDTLSAPVQLTTESTFDNPIIVPVNETPSSSNMYAVEFRIQTSDERASQITIFAGGTPSVTGIFCGVDHEGNIYAARRSTDAANKQFKFFGLVSPTGGTREVYISRIFRVK